MRHGSPREGAWHLRVIIAEMNRIASHLVGMGAYGLDLGTLQPVPVRLPRARDDSRPVRGSLRRPAHLQLHHHRRRHDDLPAQITIPPGLAALTGRSRHEAVVDRRLPLFLDWLEPRIPEYHTLLTTNSDLHQAHGRPGRAVAARWRSSYGCTGPVLRGSGVDHDLRRDGEKIYTRMYEGYDVRIVARWPRSNDRPAREVVLGDNWCRFYVRMLEVVQVDRPRAAGARPLSDGRRAAYRVPFKMTTKLPRARSYLETECPRGQMGFYVVGNDDADPAAGPGQELVASATSRSRPSSARAA